MKKYSSILLALATLSFAASCAKEVRVDNPKEESAEMIDITIVASKKPEPVTSAGTKTFVDGSVIKWSNSGEKIKAFEVATPNAGATVTTGATSAVGTTDDSGATMAFGVSFEDKSSGYSSFDYYAIYPSSAYHAGAGDPNIGNIAINTSAAQTPTSDSFDASADLLIAKKSTKASQPTELDMQFARMVAIGKMTIKNLGSSEEITKITFSAKVGAEDVILAGRTAFNLETGLPVSTYGKNVPDHSIILNYEGKGITANSAAGMTAYFTCYPFALNSETPGSFKVIVETATKAFTKEVTVDSAKGLVFKTGQASVFSVNMNGIAGGAKAVNLPYAYLEHADVSGEINSNTYVNASVTKAHGDKWSMFANMPVTGCLGVRRNDNGSNDSYIKLPDFANDIKTVVVTLNSPTADKTITLENSATGTAGSIASLTTTAATVYTFDLSGSSDIKTAYFRSSGFQSQVKKIEVYAGTDNRTKLANPTNVNAELNTDDPSVTNTIDVTWDAVEHASSYIVTLVPDSGDDVVTVVNTNSCSVTGLQYNMEYLAAVEASGDPYLYKNSDAVDASDVVETGAEPSGAKWELVSSVSNITAGDLYLLATNNKTNVYNGSISSGHLNTVAVTPAGNKISDEDLPASAAQIMLVSSGKTNGYYLKVGDNYISATKASSGGFKNDGTDEFEWVFSGTNGMNAVGTTIAAYIRSYNNSQFRSYASTSNGDVFYLYKFVDPRNPAPISWSSATGTATWSSSGITTNLPSLTNSQSLAIAYSSSNSEVATVDGSGVVTIVGGGSATISATFTALSESAYKTTTVSYTLTVTDSRETCATPTFSPSAGEVAANTTVTISCGTAGATIYYTTDGTDPTTNSTVYSSAITIDAAKTIKAFAVKENYKNSEVATAAYTISGVKRDYYRLITDISQISAGTYVVGALKSDSATNNFYFGKASTSSGDWVVSDGYVTVADVEGVRRFEVENLPSGAVEFTFTGDNTNGFTICNGSNYLYFTASQNRKLAFAAAGSTQKWKVVTKDNPLVTGGVCLSAVGSTYTISENSTASGAIRGYANSTKYRAIYLFKKVNE